MNIDSATLDDIEALSSTTQSGPTLWHLIDRTRTRAGRRMLHQRLVSLSHTVEEIEALQRAHQALATEAALYIRLLDRANCDAIEAYLASRWQLPATMSLSARLAGSLWSGRWYWKYLQNVTVGQCQVIDLLAAADELRQHLEASRCLALEQARGVDGPAAAPGVAPSRSFTINGRPPSVRSTGARDGEVVAGGRHRMRRNGRSHVESGGRDG